MPRRWRLLPAQGTLLINTDLHGNLEDFVRVSEMFDRIRSGDPNSHWVILGDLVHGPSDEARKRFEGLYDYDDRSFEIVERVIDRLRSDREHVHFVLGNHDHGHVGGPHTQKFHDDEVAHLESGLSSSQVDTMHELFRDALLAVIAPCGLLMTHGAPSDELDSLDDLDDLSLDPPKNNPHLNRVLRSFLTFYGQSREVTAALLDKLSLEVGHRLTTVVHGHDKVEEGWFAEGGNQLCPVIFGAFRTEKRCVVVDLAKRYEGSDDLHDGGELVKLYPE